jgi:hypothetical protein
VRFHRWGWEREDGGQRIKDRGQQMGNGFRGMEGMILVLGETFSAIG